jgi:hypothetical protein
MTEKKNYTLYDCKAKKDIGEHNFIGSTPAQAARKAVKALIPAGKAGTVEFCIRQKSTGSKHNQIRKYEGTQKMVEPNEFQRKTYGEKNKNKKVALRTAHYIGIIDV